MKVRIKENDFTARYMDLYGTEEGLSLCGQESTQMIAYGDIEEFSIWEDRKGKSYFSCVWKKGLEEGEIVEPTEMDGFVRQLKDRIGGQLQIQIRKN